MKSKQFIRTTLLLLVLLANVSCDQLSKRMVRQSVSDNENIDLIHSYFTLTRVENSGAFLSLGHSLPEPVRIVLLMILPSLTLIFAVIYLLRKINLSAKTSIAIAFIAGGGIGNLYDRIVYGSVTDFLHIDFVIFQTGVFNLADVSIMTGMFILIFGMMKKRELVNQQGE